MARSPVTRLVAAALAVATLASCSDDPEPVATNGGLQLASTTTEQPRSTEPETTTTSTSTTTSTTTTTTEAPTTTTTEPPPPIADTLLAALPGADALPGGDWSRREARTPAAGDPTPLCEGSDVATPLTGLVYEGRATDGAVAQYERADGSGLVRIVVAPLADAGARVAEARAELPACPDAVSVLDWPAQGDGAVAFGRTRPLSDGAAGEQTHTWVLAHVGPVVAGLEVQALQVEGQELAAPPTPAEIQAFLQGTLDAVVALGSTPSG